MINTVGLLYCPLWFIAVNVGLKPISIPHYNSNDRPGSSSFRWTGRFRDGSFKLPSAFNLTSPFSSIYLDRPFCSILCFMFFSSSPTFKDNCGCSKKLNFHCQISQNRYMYRLWKLVHPLMRYRSFGSSSIKKKNSFPLSTKIFFRRSASSTSTSL